MFFSQIYKKFKTMHIIYKHMLKQTGLNGFELQQNCCCRCRVVVVWLRFCLTVRLLKSRSSTFTSKLLLFHTTWVSNQQRLVIVCECKLQSSLAVFINKLLVVSNCLCVYIMCFYIFGFIFNVTMYMYVCVNNNFTVLFLCWLVKV